MKEKLGRPGILRTALLGLLLILAVGCGSKDPPPVSSPPESTEQPPGRLQPFKPFETIKPH